MTAQRQHHTELSKLVCGIAKLGFRPCVIGNHHRSARREQPGRGNPASSDANNKNFLSFNIHRGWGLGVRDWANPHPLIPIPYLSFKDAKLNNEKRIAMTKNRKKSIKAQRGGVSARANPHPLIPIPYLSFKVDKLNNAKRIAMIKNRKTSFEAQIGDGD